MCGTGPDQIPDGFYSGAIVVKLFCVVHDHISIILDIESVSSIFTPHLISFRIHDGVIKEMGNSSMIRYTSAMILKKMSVPKPVTLPPASVAMAAPLKITLEVDPKES
mmetsp:Transcript_27629/g.57826  ORF Transcript_27629/g.57826 Transcript_27629/m.57826 type:complete len:108 (+) Transcript_27629:820-1143(+)